MATSRVNTCFDWRWFNFGWIDLLLVAVAKTITWLMKGVALRSSHRNSAILVVQTKDGINSTKNNNKNSGA